MNKSRLSIIIPVYNEEQPVELFVKEFKDKTKKLPLDKMLYFIDDGSSDDTLKVIKRIAITEGNIKYISLTRNFGKEAALLAGLKNVDGDFVTVIDVDLQDPPELLNEMFELINKGYDMVGVKRTTRKGESYIRSFFSHLFYKVINKISRTKIIEGARDYRLMTWQVVESILALQERNRFSKGLFSWVGYNTFYLEYENKERVAGTTSWSFCDLLRYSIDGFINFSEIPLNMATYLGVMSFLASALLGVFYTSKTLFWGEEIKGFPTLAVLILLLGGLQLLSIGITGKYIAKTFVETKKRPNYIIKESNIEKHE